MENLVLHINSYQKQQTENNKTQIKVSEWLKSMTSCSKFLLEEEEKVTSFNTSDYAKFTLNFFRILLKEQKKR